MSAQAARSFDRWAADYDAYRPGYPDALFEAIGARIGLPERPRVVDLGAGTGLSTFAMVDRGWEVTAVEPGHEMVEILRQRATAKGQQIQAIEAAAEETGLADADFDLAVAAQAFHWFDRPRAVAEMARIVRPGGGMALFWNVRDAERSAFVADYERLIRQFFGIAGVGQYLQHGPEAEATATRAAFAAQPAFEDLEFEEPTHEIEMSADEFIGMAFTATYLRNRPDREQERFRAELIGLLEQHRLTHRRFAIPYRIHLWTARRSDR